MSWKAIPLPVRVALGLQLAVAFAILALQLYDGHNMKYVLRTELAIDGLSYAARILFAIGFYDLARRLTGRARVGVQIAMWAIVLDLAVMIARVVASTQVELWEHHTVELLFRYGWAVAGFAIVAGLALAAWDRLALALGGLVVAVVVSQPPVLADAIYKALDLGFKSMSIVWGVLSFVNVAIVLVLVLAVARDGGDASEPELAVTGFHRASSALWLRVIAVGALPALLLFAAMGNGGDGAAKMIGYGMIAAAIINVWSFTQFAVGAIGVARARLADMRAVPLYVAAVGALASAGLTLYQTPELYKMKFGHDSFGGGDFAQDYADAWSIVGPIVAIGSLLALAGAIAGFAGRRAGAFNDLHSEASGKGIAAAALMLVPLAITTWLLPGVSSEGSAVLMVLVWLGCAIAAVVMMAKLCTLAADSVTREPSLPTATVI